MNKFQRRRHLRKIQLHQRHLRRHLTSEMVLLRYGLISQEEYEESVRLFTKWYKHRLKYTDAEVSSTGANHILNCWKRHIGIVRQKEIDASEE